VAASIPALLRQTAERHPDGVAVVDDDATRTWGELAARSRDVAAALVAGGLEVGDRVAIWAPNGLRWIEAVLGLWQAGAVLVPINTRFKGPEAAELLHRSGARRLVATRTFLDTDYVAMLERAGGELPALERTSVPAGDEWDAFVGEATAAARGETERRSAALGTDDLSDVLFTSGTTGVPKGVVMTHGRTRCVATDWVAMTGLAQGDRYLMVNPYFHMFGLKAGILASLVAGATMLPEPVFDVDRVLSRVEQERVTVLPGAPTLYQSILDHPDRSRYDLSTLRVAVTGAADIPVELIRRVQQELPFRFVVTGYGLTEAGTAAATSPDDSPEVIATTVGRARPGFSLRIVDDAGRDVAQGEAGEILLRGGSVMSHYLDDPEGTAQTLSADGWLKTGDLGVIDGNDCLRIVGRVKDMFIVGGFNAYPAEIENVLLRHPDVQQVAVIGIPDERLGEVGMAFVVTTSTDPGLADAVLAWAKEQMANYKVPRALEVVDELPVNATGKVVKDELRARVAATP
jgi:acyl-CoA synthetase (AMP-forming)/AMP-acid ligase II